MTTSQISTRIDRILELLSHRGADSHPPDSDVSAAPLDRLFDLLLHAERREERAEAEELIWALWCTHEDESATRALHKATGAMNRGELDDARRTLDDLVASHPRWAEVWNKRATLHFLAEDDLASLDDILATLRLEPRHFGAICGFGQICLRHEDEFSGRAAFQFALELNPGLSEVRDATRALEARVAPTLH